MGRIIIFQFRLVRLPFIQPGPNATVASILFFFSSKKPKTTIETNEVVTKVESEGLSDKDDKKDVERLKKLQSKGLFLH